jgi:hypothetical protein
MIHDKSNTLIIFEVIPSRTMNGDSVEARHQRRGGAEQRALDGLEAIDRPIDQDME